MGIPANYRHILVLVIVAALAVLNALKADPTFATYAWVGGAIMLLTTLHSIFTEAPQTAAKVADLKSQVSVMAARLGKSGPGAGLVTLTLLVGLKVAFVVAVLTGCNACSAAQNSAAVVATVDDTICILNHSTQTIPQIIAACGQQVATSVINVLDAHKAAEIREAADAGAK